VNHTEQTEHEPRIVIRRQPDARLTKMMLNAVDKRLSKAERALWQRQAWMVAKRIEGGHKS
jgi:hypothetical protein